MSLVTARRLAAGVALAAAAAMLFWAALWRNREVVLRQSLSWEQTAPHTLSIVEVGGGGPRYWGYYGLQDGCGAVGLARTDDLAHWAKRGAPLFLNGRWPSVLLRNGVFSMAYTRDYCRDSYLVLATSKDGISFNDVGMLVVAEPNLRNQNPNLFQDPRTGDFLLYWYRGDDRGFWKIHVRRAGDLAGLANSASERVTMYSERVLAARNVIYLNGRYYLATEGKRPSGKWKVDIYVSTEPERGFQPISANPVLDDDSACLMQYVVDGTVRWFFCRMWFGRFWTVDHKQFSLQHSLYSTE